jgi:hypothetical protein
MTSNGILRHALFIEQGKHEGEDEERDGQFQHTAQERLLRAVKQGRGTRQRGADDERHEEQEREGKDQGERENPHSIGFSGKRIVSYGEGRSTLDLPLIHGV